MFARRERTAPAADAIRRYRDPPPRGDVIHAAERADVAASVDADVRMRRAILAARAA